MMKLHITLFVASLLGAMALGPSFLAGAEAPFRDDGTDVDSLVRVICSNADMASRREAVRKLLDSKARLTQCHNNRLTSLLPGKANSFTLDLVQLLGAMGNEKALDALIKYSTEQRVGKLVQAYAAAIEALETRLKVRRKLHPAFRKMVEEIRESRKE